MTPGSIHIICMLMKKEAVSVEFIRFELISSNEMMGISDVNNSFTLSFTISFVELSMIEGISVTMNLYFFMVFSCLHIIFGKFSYHMFQLLL